MEIIICLLAMFGLTFLIRESDGPWGIMAWIRNKLMSNKYVGVFFYKLLDCPFCTGNWAGFAVYLLSSQAWHWQFLILYGLASGAINLIIDACLARLNRD